MRIADDFFSAYANYNIIKLLYIPINDRHWKFVMECFSIGKRYGKSNQIRAIRFNTKIYGSGKKNNITKSTKC